MIVICCLVCSTSFLALVEVYAQWLLWWVVAIGVARWFLGM